MSTVWNQWQQPAGEAVDLSGGYGDMTKDDLQKLLEHRGLPKTGNKDELIARLEADNARSL